MPKKKYSKPSTRTGEEISSAEPGDFCYYLTTSNKTAFAEIKKVLTENDILVFQILCQTDYKFMSLPAIFCAFDEKSLKGKKRADLYVEVK